MNKDVLDSLLQLSIIKRLQVAEQYYRQYDIRFADGLRHAAEIAASDGWKYLAPAWLVIKPNKQ